MRVRQGRWLALVLTLVSVACRHSFTREEAVTAIGRHETIGRLLEPDTERVAHETVADCRAIYDSNPVIAEMAGDSAWIFLSSAGWMDLADVDAPSDRRQKKHCRGVLTSKADKTAFQEGPDPNKTPWTSYWVVETAHTKLEIFDIPGDSIESNSAVADFQLIREPTAIGEILHRPKLTEESARLLTTTLTGHFRRNDDGWRLESFDEKK
jgi:hypothetical protein